MRALDRVAEAEEEEQALVEMQLAQCDLFDASAEGGCGESYARSMEDAAVDVGPDAAATQAQPVARVDAGFCSEPELCSERCA